jgi:hypothetical protein
VVGRLHRVIHTQVVRESKESARARPGLPDSIGIPPMRLIGRRGAELARVERRSTLGAEAVAAADHLDASLCVWEGNDGPGIRLAARTAGVECRAMAH